MVLQFWLRAPKFTGYQTIIFKFICLHQILYIDVKIENLECCRMQIQTDLSKIWMMMFKTSHLMGWQSCHLARTASNIAAGYSGVFLRGAIWSWSTHSTLQYVFSKLVFSSLLERNGIWILWTSCKVSKWGNEPRSIISCG